MEIPWKLGLISEMEGQIAEWMYLTAVTYCMHEHALKQPHKEQLACPYTQIQLRIGP